MDPAALAAAQQANKLKSAKRNEKRKEKRATEKAAAGAGPDRRSASAADATAARMQQLNLGTSGRGNSSGAAPAAPASPAAAEDDPTATDRQIRALKKKVSAWQSAGTSMCDRTYCLPAGSCTCVDQIRESVRETWLTSQSTRLLACSCGNARCCSVKWMRARSSHRRRQGSWRDETSGKRRSQLWSNNTVDNSNCMHRPAQQCSASIIPCR